MGRLNANDTAPNGATSTLPPLLHAKAMQIICGTDFSRAAAQAADVAAAMAARLSEPLLLVHAVDEPARAQLPGELRESLSSFGLERLREEAERLAASSGTQVEEIFRSGPAETVLIELAREPESRLLVLAPLGTGAAERLALGRIAARAWEDSPIPTLLVRNAAPLLSWLQGKRSLRVFVEGSFSVTSEAALGWIRWLSQLGPLDVVVAYLENLTLPGDAATAPSAAAASMLAKTADVQLRCLRQRVRKLLGDRKVRIRVERGWHQSDAHLIQTAAEERADLLIAGIPPEDSAKLVKPGPKGIVHYAPMNVFCVPADWATR